MTKKLYNRLVKKRPYLWWWVKDKERLSTESVVQPMFRIQNEKVNYVKQLPIKIL
jgi:hypothetical protein